MLRNADSCCARLQAWWPRGFPYPPTAPWIVGISFDDERIATREEILSAVRVVIENYSYEELKEIVEQGDLRRESPLHVILGGLALAAAAALAALVVYSDDAQWPGGERFAEIEGMGGEENGRGQGAGDGGFWNPPGEDPCDDPLIYC